MNEIGTPLYSRFVWCDLFCFRHFVVKQIAANSMPSHTLNLLFIQYLLFSLSLSPSLSVCLSVVFFFLFRSSDSTIFQLVFAKSR